MPLYVYVPGQQFLFLLLLSRVRAGVGMKARGRGTKSVRNCARSHSGSQRVIILNVFSAEKAMPLLAIVSRRPVAARRSSPLERYGKVGVACATSRLTNMS